MIMMLNISQTKIAFADWEKEDVLNKSATRILYNGDEGTWLKLEVTETLNVKGTHVGRWTSRTLWEKLLYRKMNIWTHFTNMLYVVNRRKYVADI